MLLLAVACVRREWQLVAVAARMAGLGHNSQYSAAPPAVPAPPGVCLLSVCCRGDPPGLGDTFVGHPPHSRVKYSTEFYTFTCHI